MLYVTCMGQHKLNLMPPVVLFVCLGVFMDIIFTVVYKTHVENNGNTENIPVMTEHLVTWLLL